MQHHYENMLRKQATEFTSHRQKMSKWTPEPGEPITLEQKIVALGMTIKQTAKVAERVELAIGMKAMVIINIATEADLANGTRGIVTDIVLDPREVLDEPDEDGAVLLKYPPPLVLFRPDVATKERFPGLPEGIIPISPFQGIFSVIRSKWIKRQLAITPAYAFTDFKAQGQTIEYVISSSQIWRSRDDSRRRFRWRFNHSKCPLNRPKSWIVESPPEAIQRFNVRFMLSILMTIQLSHLILMPSNEFESTHESS
jgi:hypothetical protein